MQLDRWGLLEAVKAAGTPPVTSATFHYGDERLRAYDPDNEGVDALIAGLRHAATHQRAPAQPAPVQPAPAQPAPAPPDPVPARWPAGPASAPAVPESHCDVNFCTAPDGVRIAWSSLGEGPPIIRSANWMSHLQAELDLARCRHLNDSLAAGNRLIRYDMRANGLSDWDAADLSFEGHGRRP